jgi:hypothetical protein
VKIISIEPTPSPNTMKIILSEELPATQKNNYKDTDDLTNAPEFVQKLMRIPGVKNIYHVADFLALDRYPKTPWEDILPKVRQTLGDESREEPNAIGVEKQLESFGEVKVFIQMYRNIPVQVKLNDGQEERRFGLPSRFMDAVMQAAKDSSDYVMVRKWVEQSARYGGMDEIGKEIVEEISASYDEERLQHLAAKENYVEKKPEKITLKILDHPDWRVRYAALDKMDPTIEDLPILEKALDDDKMSIRRLACAYLGMIEDKKVLPLLYKALQDRVVTVRRTAGDCISDLGYTEAIPEMIKALKDPSKLVRWRAAMYLYEVGDETALPALKAALDEPEFEVKMQIRMAIERIEDGEEGKGSVWQQMTQAFKKD